MGFSLVEFLRNAGIPFFCLNPDFGDPSRRDLDGDFTVIQGLGWIGLDFLMMRFSNGILDDWDFWMIGILDDWDLRPKAKIQSNPSQSLNPIKSQSPKSPKSGLRLEYPRYPVSHGINFHGRHGGQSAIDSVVEFDDQGEVFVERHGELPFGG